MRRTSGAALLLFTSLALISCGHDRSAPPVVTQILSDPVSDGDIARDPATNTYTITQGNAQSLFAGVDPATGREYRAFLDFPLTGTNGIRCDAGIVSAALDIVINSIIPQPLTATIPIRIDLVAFQPPTLVESDFDRTLQPALATITLNPPISQADFGRHATIDVTPLMNEAQRSCQTNFQLRIMEDLGAASPGIIEINDTIGSNRSLLAPLLQIEHY